MLDENLQMAMNNKLIQENFIRKQLEFRLINDSNCDGCQKKAFKFAGIINHLSINIPNPDEQYTSLKQCIEKTIDQEMFSGLCSACYSKNKHSRWVNKPESLLIMINRVQQVEFALFKIKTKVYLSDIITVNLRRYWLSVIICHEGDMTDYGHWVAYVKKDKDTYFKCSDNIVSITTDKSFLKSSESVIVLYNSAL